MKNKWLPALTILLLGCIWGSSFILIKRGRLAFDAVQVAGWRQFLAGVVLLPWVLRYSVFKPWKEGVQGVKEKLISKRDYTNLFLSGLIGNGIPAFFFSYAGGHIPSGLSGILNAFTPMFTLVLGVLLFSDRFTRNGMLGVLAGILGAFFLFGPGVYDTLFLGKAQAIDPLSLVLVLSAAMMYGYNINLIKHRLHHLPPMVKTAYPFFFMGMGYMFLLLFSGVHHAWEKDPVQAWESFMYLAILGILGSAISMVLFNILIKYTTALVASTNTFIIPIVAVAWGLIDQEELTWNMFAGLLLSLVGVYLVMRKEKHLPQTEDEVEELKEFSE